MGWAWALFFCHSALTDVMVRAAMRFGGISYSEACTQLVRDKAPVLQPRKGRPLLCPYVDNANAIGFDKADTLAFFRVMLTVFEERSFTVQDLVYAAKIGASRQQ